MALDVTKQEVWAGDIDDQPGGLAEVLERLAEAGADLECVISRRQPDQPGTGVVFVCPIKGRKVQDAAREAGLSKAEDIATLRIEGPNKIGIGAQMTAAMSDEGINVRGVSAMALGNKFISYIGFDSDQDATRAMRALKNIEARPAARRRAEAPGRAVAERGTRSARQPGRERARSAR